MVRLTVVTSQQVYCKVIHYNVPTALEPLLFVIVLDYDMRTALKGKEELGFMLTKRISRRHPAVTITDVSYADDIAILTN